MSGIYKKGGNVSVFGKRKLRKIQLDKWIGGVCAGVAYWIGAPTWFVRFVWFFIFVYHFDTLNTVVLQIISFINFSICYYY